MDCTEANRLTEPFLNDRLTVHDTWLYLKHIKECPSCRDELDLECIIKAASDPVTTNHADYDFSHHLDELIQNKERWIRSCFLTDALDVLLILCTIAAVIFKLL